MLRVMDPCVTIIGKDENSESDDNLIVHESWQKPSKTLSVSPRRTIHQIDINRVEEIRLLQNDAQVSKRQKSQEGSFGSYRLNKSSERKLKNRSK